MSKWGKILLIFAGSATLASAQIIISDNFDRNGNLNGSSPTIGGGTWTTWVTPGQSGLFTTSTTGGGEAINTGNNSGDFTLDGVWAIPSAYLTSPGGSLKDGIYTLSLTASGNQVLFGLGSQTVARNPWTSPNNNLAMGSIGIRGGAEQYAVFPGPGVGTYDLGGDPLTGPATFTLTFDVSSTAPWTLSATLNGTPILFGSSTTFTYSTIGDPLAGQGNSNDIFLSTYGATTGTFQNLVFSEVVPEPSTWAMMFAGLVFLGFCVRRKNAGF